MYRTETNDRRPNQIQRIAYALVWLAVASGAVVFTEPAPVDVLTMALVVGLPLVGLVAWHPALLAAFAVWLVCAAGALVATSQGQEIDRALIHTLISIYLYAAFLVFAAFVAQRPQQHTKLILDAYSWAAAFAAVAGIVGYFGLLPGAHELLTKYGRAAGTFKDPNVYGPFLAPALIYALHRMLNDRPAQAVAAGALAMLLAFGVLLSFSRGAWFNAGVGIAVYLYFSLILAPTNRQRVKLIGLGSLAVLSGALVLLVAAQSDGIGDLLSHRAALTQDYDVGPDGRFGGQDKAMALILENPLGLGALEFGTHHHHEDVHNVYLSMFLNAGWLGGLVFAAMMLATAVLGLAARAARNPDAPPVRHRLRRLPRQRARRLHHRHRPLAPLLPADGHRLGPDGRGRHARRRNGHRNRPASTYHPPTTLARGAG